MSNPQKNTSPQTDVCSDASGSGTKLFAKPQSFNDGAVSFDFLLHEVFQKTAALTNHFQKTTTGMMVFLVVLQVFCQIADAFRKNGNLDFRGSRVSFVDAVGFDQYLFSCRFQHNKFLLNTDHADNCSQRRRSHGSVMACPCGHVGSIS